MMKDEMRFRKGKVETFCAILLMAAVMTMIVAIPVLLPALILRAHRMLPI